MIGWDTVGCLFILGSILITRRYRNFGQRLIMYLSISASLDTIPYVNQYN